MRDEWDDNSLKRTTYPSIARPGVKTIPNPDSIGTYITCHYYLLREMYVIYIIMLL